MGEVSIMAFLYCSGAAVFSMWLAEQDYHRRYWFRTALAIALWPAVLVFMACAAVIFAAHDIFKALGK